VGVELEVEITAPTESEFQVAVASHQNRLRRRAPSRYGRADRGVQSSPCTPGLVVSVHTCRRSELPSSLEVGSPRHAKVRTSRFRRPPETDSWSATKRLHDSISARCQRGHGTSKNRPRSPGSRRREPGRAWLAMPKRRVDDAGVPPSCPGM